jgi:hypothetical protein
MENIPLKLMTGNAWPTQIFADSFSLQKLRQEGEFILTCFGSSFVHMEFSRLSSNKMKPMSLRRTSRWLLPILWILRGGHRPRAARFPDLTPLSVPERGFAKCEGHKTRTSFFFLNRPLLPYGVEGVLLVNLLDNW